MIDSMNANNNPIEDVLPFEAVEFLISLNFSKSDYNLGYATKRFDVTRKVGDRYKVEYVESGELVNCEECNRCSDFKNCTIPAITPKEAYSWFNEEGFLNLRTKETCGTNGMKKYFVQVILQNCSIIIMDSKVKNSASEAIVSLFDSAEFKAIASKRIPH